MVARGFFFSGGGSSRGAGAAGTPRGGLGGHGGVRMLFGGGRCISRAPGAGKKNGCARLSGCACIPQRLACSEWCAVRARGKQRPRAFTSRRRARARDDGGGRGESVHRAGVAGAHVGGGRGKREAQVCGRGRRRGGGVRREGVAALCVARGDVRVRHVAAGGMLCGGVRGGVVCARGGVVCARGGVCAAVCAVWCAATDAWAAGQQCVYELVVDTTPVRLWADIEFIAPDLECGEVRRRHLESLLKTAIRESFGVAAPVMFWGTSTRKVAKGGYKHSYQLRVPSIVFENNNKDGTMAKWFAQFIQLTREDPLLLCPETGRHIVDPLVYSRSRCVRAAFCAKRSDARRTPLTLMQGVGDAALAQTDLAAFEALLVEPCVGYEGVDVLRVSGSPTMRCL
eukprot:3712928-Rhodomonas_salina.1